MAIDFKSITLEVIDINTNSTPDIYINQNSITFSRRVLDDLNFPQFVQYCLDTAHKVFAIRVCKGSEAKATPFSKPKAEQNFTLACKSRNLREIIVSMIPEFNPQKRYKITGEYDHENRVMYFDIGAAEVSDHHNCLSKGN